MGVGSREASVALGPGGPWGLSQVKRPSCWGRSACAGAVDGGKDGLVALWPEGVVLSQSGAV